MTNEEMREIIEKYADRFKTRALIANGDRCARDALCDIFSDKKEEIRKVITELGVRALGEELTKVGYAILAEEVEEMEED